MKKLLAVLFLLAGPLYAAPPWIGVPDPSFGITETAGSYNCYVDRTHPSATDTSNPSGSAGTPRLTVPTSLSAGTRCEVHGTGYTLASTVTWASSGTSGSPVYVSGIDSGGGKPTFTGSQSTLRITGSYIIVEGLDIISSHFTFGTTGASVDHAVLRTSIVRDWPDTSTTSIVNCTATSGGVGCSDIVIYDNVIKNNGSLTGVDDVHGIHISGSQFGHDVWILDNEIFGHEGDSIQIGSATASEPWPIRIYISGNTLHEDRENAIDIKQARDVVVSNNLMYGYLQSATSSGEVVVVHNSAQRIWMLFNTIHTGRSGIIGTGQEDFYIVGNVVYNIEHGALDTDFDATLLQTGGSAIQARANTGDLYIINNTVTDSDRGIYVQNNQTAHVVNNIIYDLKGVGAAIGFENTTANTNSTTTHNLFDQAVSDCRVQISSTRHLTLAAYTAANPTKCSGCAEGSAAFTNAATRDYTILTGSAAKNVGTGTHAAYTDFSSLYGVDIRVDRANSVRPLGSEWDIGAYEFVEEGVPDPPATTRVPRAIFRRGSGGGGK